MDTSTTSSDTLNEIRPITTLFKDGFEYLGRCPHCDQTIGVEGELAELRGEQYHHSGETGCQGYFSISDNVKRVDSMDQLTAYQEQATQADATPYPECEKLSKHREAITEMVAFLAFLRKEDIELGVWQGSDNDPNLRLLNPERQGEVLAAKFFGIDMAIVDKERSNIEKELGL
ncbi:hypothetical protein AB6D11_18580 [Vibrio splendidus]